MVPAPPMPTLEGRAALPQLPEPPVHLVKLGQQPHRLFAAEASRMRGKHRQAASQVLDLGRFHDYEHTFVVDAGAATSDITGVRNDIAGLQHDFPTVQADQSNLPDYVPANTPIQKDVTNAIANANAAIASAISTINGYINQANQYVLTAFQYAADAFQAGSCGIPPAAPAPEPPNSQ